MQKTDASPLVPLNIWRQPFVNLAIKMAMIVGGNCNLAMNHRAIRRKALSKDKGPAVHYKPMNCLQINAACPSMQSYSLQSTQQLPLFTLMKMHSVTEKLSNSLQQRLFCKPTALYWKPSKSPKQAETDLFFYTKFNLHLQMAKSPFSLKINK